MPPKKTKSKKTSILDSDEDIHSHYLDAQYNPDLIPNLLQELKKQVESKCNHIQNDADFMITSMQEAFHLELIKLPTQVKKMPLSRFKQEFGESLEAVTRGAIGGGTSHKSISKSHGSTMRGRPSMNFQTPMTSKHHQYIPETPSSRNPKEGEVILSTNGSPLGVFNTAVKPKSGVSIIPPTPGIFVPLDSGEVLDVDALDVESLSGEVKQDALIKMQTMMSNMQKLMSKLESSK
jgi:Cell division cycle-associated protein 8/Nbl1 / Borealin N terminal